MFPVIAAAYFGVALLGSLKVVKLIGKASAVAVPAALAVKNKRLEREHRLGLSSDTKVEDLRFFFLPREAVPVEYAGEWCLTEDEKLALVGRADRGLKCRTLRARSNRRLKDPIIGKQKPASF